MSATDRLSVLREVHTLCYCEIDTPPSEYESAVEASTISKDGCDIAIEGLIMALDCDACRAFSDTDIRPDVISIRMYHGDYAWLVIEMKKIMREHAAEQARAALRKLGREDGMFPIRLSKLDVVFVVKISRKSNNTIMRNIGIIKEGPWRVRPRLLLSGNVLDA